MRLLILLLPLIHPNDPPERTIWDDDVLEAIIEVESSYRDGASGDSGRAVGILQIWKITVRDCNRIIGKQKYKYEDRLSREKSIEMFYIYQRHYNPTGDLEKGCKLWNSGPDCNGGEKYYKKVLKILARKESN